ncbi:oxidoreductase [Halorhodospira halochloris]|uniref:Oxidoreductase n=1 Tax=Halorhodospira halochloris TaxID=1052 RepID=A0A0X8X9E5_HALHR|nr:aldo/keto reductase [Halorhodospira halochloris]MBK1652549.1 aldo/keto reductase [Halorhodospira halochloris]MCG5548732.1 aldo/keto reductase [Halorhodospira halochloris]BAU57875.1 oxidoreductase [Halorhodospira halochloris]
MEQSVILPSGEKVPALGQGTWHMGERSAERKDEVAALKAGLDEGLSLIDTAEMYGDGGAERVVADAIAGRREEVFLVSKVFPWNASRKGVISACERSLRRLGTDHLDLYLLHWRGGEPLAETVAGFQDLQRGGKIRYWGVSNLDADDMRELHKVPGGEGCATNQLLYHLNERGIEWDTLPLLRGSGIPVMAYCPLGQGNLLKNRRLEQFAERYGMTAAQAALAWLLDQGDIMVIPKTRSPQRVAENRGALEISFSEEQRAELNDVFPPPQGPRPLAIV